MMMMLLLMLLLSWLLKSCDIAALVHDKQQFRLKAVVDTSDLGRSVPSAMQKNMQKTDWQLKLPCDHTQGLDNVISAWAKHLETGYMNGHWRRTTFHNAHTLRKISITVGQKLNGAIWETQSTSCRT